MATTDRPGEREAAGGFAAACRGAEFLHLVARADGDALAAAGTLAAAREALDAPYHVSVARTSEALAPRRGDADGETLAIGTDDEPAGIRAYRAARELGVDPDPIPALAGAVAAGHVPGEAGADALDDAGIERRAGVAIPTADPEDGLAHTALAHADFSGDPAAVRDALSTLDDPSSRQVASLLALAAGGDATDRAAVAVERALCPYAIEGPFATLGGYADVLSALARRAPGLGLALVLGVDARDAALEEWRAHARAAHAAVRDADPARHDGFVVVHTDGPVETVARLVRDFRSPEPVALAVGDGEAGVAAVDEPVADTVAAAAEAAGGSALARGTRGYARLDDEAAFVDAFRGSL